MWIGLLIGGGAVGTITALLRICRAMPPEALDEGGVGASFFVLGTYTVISAATMIILASN